MPPERLKESKDDKQKYGLSADMWAMGVILLEMFRGEHPFPSLKRAEEGNYGQLPDHEDAAIMVQRLLMIEPTDRLTCFNVQQQFKIMHVKRQML